MKPLASLIDHTVLKPDATATMIDQCVQEAKEYGFRSVCINPFWVERVAGALKGTAINTCTVIGFPLGANRLKIKLAEAELALMEGANELDMVINIGAIKSKDFSAAEREIKALAEIAKNKVLKVILETALLTDDEIVKSCQIAKNSGAHFVKTSTGFAHQGATTQHVRLMRQTVGPAIGVKASGGIKSLEEALAMIEAGANRLGLSKSVAIVQSQSEIRS